MKKAALVLAMVMGLGALAQPAVADDAATAEPAVVAAEAPAEAKAPDPPPAESEPPPAPPAPESPATEEAAQDNVAKKAEEPASDAAAAKPVVSGCRRRQGRGRKFTGTPPGTLTRLRS